MVVKTDVIDIYSNITTIANTLRKGMSGMEGVDCMKGVEGVEVAVSRRLLRVGDWGTTR